MRDAAGELADRLQSLRLLERRFGQLAPSHLLLEAPRVTERVECERKHGDRYRQADREVQQHRVPELGGERRGFDARRHVDRQAHDLAIAHPPFDAIHARDREHSARLRIPLEGGLELARGYRPLDPDLGIAGQQRAIAP